MSYNPSIFTATNKPIGLRGTPVDARSYYYDGVNYVFRAYVDTAEVLSYLIGTDRVGQFSAIVNTGGTLLNGVITGGTNAEWWFKDGITDGDLVAKGSGGGAAVWGGITGTITDQTDLVTYVAANGGTLVSRTFNPVVAFDGNFAETTTQTADIALTLAASPVDYVNGLITVVGDGTHALTFPAYDPTPGVSNWINANGQTFDNRSRNNIWLIYDGLNVEYSIVTAPTPDVTPPVLVSAIISNATPTLIVLTYSEPLDMGSVPATSDFSVNLSKAVTAVSIAGSQVTVTVNTAYVNGDVPTISYTAGGNPIKDPTGNLAANLVNQSVTNNVLAASTSISIAATNQIQKSTVVPTNLAFGSGGTDTPISVDFWAKRSASSGQTICNMGSMSANNGVYIQIIDNTGAYYFQCINNAGQQIIIQTNVGFSTGVWTHFAFTYDGTRLASGMKVYMNASLVAVTSLGASYPGQNALPSDTVLAVMGDAANGQPATHLLLDNLNFWNIALTSGEVTTLYNGGALIDATTVSFAANLTASYDFDGNTFDRSASGYNLTSAVAPTYSTDHP